MADREMRLETQAITPTCRANRGAGPAWWTAVDRLRDLYDVQVAAHPDATFEVVLRRRAPAEPAPGVPGAFGDVWCCATCKRLAEAASPLPAEPVPSSPDGGDRA